MLSAIFGSPQQTALARFFVLNPDKPFSVEHVAREIARSARSVERALRPLVTHGIVSKTDGWYALPSTFPLLPELQSLFFKTEVLLRGEFAEQLQRMGNCGLIVLTGRFVMRQDTPIDLLLVGSLNRSRFASMMKRLERSGLSVHYSILSRKQFQERWSMTDRFLYSIFEGKHEILLDKWGLVSVSNAEG